MKNLLLVFGLIASFTISATSNPLLNNQAIKQAKTSPNYKNKSLIATSQTTSATQLKLSSKSVLLIDANSGKILVSKNSELELPIASISKLMMAMIVLDAKVNLNTPITITTDDVDRLRHTHSLLKVGMRIPRHELLLLALMSSENRAAHALARTTYPGGINVFLAKMNQKAKSLGMTHTQFFDPTGLTTANQSTAQDLAKMVAAAVNYNLIQQDTTTKSMIIALGHNKQLYLNTDELIRMNKSKLDKGGLFQIELSKTGFTDQAGRCLTLYSLINHKPFIMVFLDSPSINQRRNDVFQARYYLQLTT